MRALNRTIVLLALALAGCSGQDDVSGDAGSAMGTPILASFLPNAPDVVQIVVEDRAPAQQVELLGPGGRAYQAQTIAHGDIDYDQDPYAPYTREHRPRYYKPSYDNAVNAFGTATGHGGGDPPFYQSQTAQRPVAVKSVARITIGDIDGYKASWQQWRARIHFEGGRVIELPAPQPPMPLPPKG